MAPPSYVEEGEEDKREDNGGRRGTGQRQKGWETGERGNRGGRDGAA